MTAPSDTKSSDKARTPLAVTSISSAEAIAEMTFPLALVPGRRVVGEIEPVGGATEENMLEREPPKKTVSGEVASTGELLEREAFTAESLREKVFIKGVSRKEVPGKSMVAGRTSRGLFCMIKLTPA